MVLAVTPLMAVVPRTSRKSWRCALASSCAFPQNVLACTMVMSDVLISKSTSSTSTLGPIVIWATKGAKKLEIDEVAINCLSIGAEPHSLSDFKCELDLQRDTRWRLELLWDISEFSNVVVLNWNSLIHCLALQYGETKAKGEPPYSYLILN